MKNLPESPTAPTLEQWAELYGAAREMAEFAPWQDLYDSDILTLLLPYTDTPVFSSVMGRGGACFGISAYPDYEAYRRLSDLYRNIDTDPTKLHMLEQKCLVCYLGTAEELQPPDLEVEQALELTYGEADGRIVFRSLEPGYFPWFLNREEAAFLLVVLRQTLELCRDYRAGRVSAGFDGTRTLFRNGAGNVWTSSVADLPGLPPLEPVHIRDELLLPRARRSRKIHTVLELDVFYLPFPIQPDRTERPHAAQVTVLLDREAEVLAGQYLAQPDEDLDQIPSRLLGSYIQERGIPDTVYVRSERIGSFIWELCTQCGIDLRVGKLALANEFYEELTLPFELPLDG